MSPELKLFLGILLGALLAPYAVATGIDYFYRGKHPDRDTNDEER